MQVISERAPISSSSSFSPKAIRLIGHDLLWFYTYQLFSIMSRCFSSISHIAPSMPGKLSLSLLVLAFLGVQTPIFVFAFVLKFIIILWPPPLITEVLHWCITWVCNLFINLDSRHFRPAELHMFRCPKHGFPYVLLIAAFPPKPLIAA